MLLWIAQRLERPEIQYVWAIFYLAERKYLIETGMWMAWDAYVAMRDGPVPLRTFSELHAGVRFWQVGSVQASLGGWLKKLAAGCHPYEWSCQFTLHELDCLRFGIQEAQRVGCAGLGRIVCDAAWQLAGPDGLIDPLEVARTGKAQKSELDFIVRWRDRPHKMEVGQAC